MKRHSRPLTSNEVLKAHFEKLARGQKIELADIQAFVPAAKSLLTNPTQDRAKMLALGDLAAHILLREWNRCQRLLDEMEEREQDS